MSVLHGQEQLVRLTWVCERVPIAVHASARCKLSPREKTRAAQVVSRVISRPRGCQNILPHRLADMGQGLIVAGVLDSRAKPAKHNVRAARIAAPAIATEGGR